MPGKTVPKVRWNRRSNSHRRFAMAARLEEQKSACALSFGRFGVGSPSRPLRSVAVRGNERVSASDADVPIPFSSAGLYIATIPVNESKSSPPFSETLGATWAQNPAYLSTNRGMLVSEGSRINVNFADYW